MCTSGITFSDASDVLQSDIQNSMSMCAQCKNEVLNTCSSNLLSIILSVAVTCLLTITIHVIIIVVFTMTMKRKILQLLIFNKKVSFDGKRSSFNSSYFCGNKFLPKQIIFCPLESDNTGDNFIPATKYKSLHNTNGI